MAYASARKQMMLGEKGGCKLRPEIPAEIARLLKGSDPKNFKEEWTVDESLAMCIAYDHHNSRHRANIYYRYGKGTRWQKTSDTLAVYGLNRTADACNNRFTWLMEQCSLTEALMNGSGGGADFDDSIYQIFKFFFLKFKKTAREQRRYYADSESSLTEFYSDEGEKSAEIIATKPNIVKPRQRISRGSLAFRNSIKTYWATRKTAPDTEDDGRKILPFQDDRKLRVIRPAVSTEVKLRPAAAALARRNAGKALPTALNGNSSKSTSLSGGVGGSVSFVPVQQPQIYARVPPPYTATARAQPSRPRIDPNFRVPLGAAPKNARKNENATPSSTTPQYRLVAVRKLANGPPTVMPRATITANSAKSLTLKDLKATELPCEDGRQPAEMQTPSTSTDCDSDGKETNNGNGSPAPLTPGAAVDSQVQEQEVEFEPAGHSSKTSEDYPHSEQLAGANGGHPSVGAKPNLVSPVIDTRQEAAPSDDTYEIDKENAFSRPRAGELGALNDLLQHDEPGLTLRNDRYNEGRVVEPQYKGNRTSDRAITDVRVGHVVGYNVSSLPKNSRGPNPTDTTSLPIVVTKYDGTSLDGLTRHGRKVMGLRRTESRGFIFNKTDFCTRDVDGNILRIGDEIIKAEDSFNEQINKIHRYVIAFCTDKTIFARPKTGRGGLLVEEVVRMRSVQILDKNNAICNRLPPVRALDRMYSAAELRSSVRYQKFGEHTPEFAGRTQTMPAGTPLTDNPQLMARNQVLSAATTGVLSSTISTHPSEKTLASDIIAKHAAIMTAQELTFCVQYDEIADTLVLQKISGELVQVSKKKLTGVNLGIGKRWALKPRESPVNKGERVNWKKGSARRTGILQNVALNFCLIELNDGKFFCAPKQEVTSSAVDAMGVLSNLSTERTERRTRDKKPVRIPSKTQTVKDIEAALNNSYEPQVQQSDDDDDDERSQRTADDHEGETDNNDSLDTTINLDDPAPTTSGEPARKRQRRAIMTKEEILADVRVRSLLLMLGQMKENLHTDKLETAQLVAGLRADAQERSAALLEEMRRFNAGNDREQTLEAMIAQLRQEVDDLRRTIEDIHKSQD